MLVMTVDDFQIKAKKIRSKLIRIAEQSMSKKSDAEDIVQETLLRIWIAQQRWNTYENFEAVTVKTLKNCIIDYYRAHKTVHETIEDAAFLTATHTPYQQLEIKDQAKMLEKQIEQLPDLQRMIITLKDIKGYEMEDIAKITQSSIDSVRMNVSRARKKIRDYFMNF
jgi:RNA polymerase sigma-70 factor (ECF subfamily)